jgi:glutamate:Na+ symporter, ESS family
MDATADVAEVFVSLMVLLLTFLAGTFIRDRIRILRSLFLPSSVVAGFLALLAGPQVLGALSEYIAGPDAPIANGLLPEVILDVWSALPVLLISVVFAALFLGKRIPRFQEIWSIAGPIVAYGQTVAWGQYVFGILLALFILTPVFGLPPLTGALIEISFEGGHGTAAGLTDSFAGLGFPEGTDLALGLATVGVVMAMAIGIVLVNWAVRTGRVAVPYTGSAEGDEPVIPSNPHGSGALRSEQRDLAIEPLSVQLALVSLAIVIGWAILQLLILGEDALRTSTGIPSFELMRYIPLFPLAMIGGVILQILLDRMGSGDLVNRRLMRRISGTALDILIVAAIATLSIAVIGANLLPFLLLAGVGIGWNVLAFVILAPRIIPAFWFERGIPNFGQSMGMTATGLLLARMTDPADRSLTVEGFGYKQLLFEPIVGGGLFTAASLPLIVNLGPVPVLMLTAVIMVGWLIFGLFGFHYKKK